MIIGKTTADKFGALTNDDLLELSDQPARLGDTLAHDTDLTRHDQPFRLLT